MIVYGALFLGLFLLVWFRTEAWVEYCRLFHWNAISFYKDYDHKRKDDLFLTYHIYLRRYHNGFFVRLITCPICISIWFALISFLVYSTVIIGLFFILGATLLAWLTVAIGLGIMFIQLPLVIVAGLIIYGILNRLL